MDYEPSSLVQGLIDPSSYGHGVVAMMTNPAVNGVVWRMEGGIIRCALLGRETGAHPLMTLLGLVEPRGVEPLTSTLRT